MTGRYLALCCIALFLEGCASASATGGDEPAGPASPVTGTGKCEAPEASTLATLDGASGRLFGIALSATHVYWTNATPIADGIPKGGTVKRVAFTGGEPETLVSDQPLPTEIAVDTRNAYWLDGFTRELMMSPVSGAVAATLARTEQASALAIDATNAYWLKFDSTTLTSAVVKVPLAGGGAVALAPAETPTGLAVDATGVYWLDQDESRTVRLKKVALEGGEPTTLFSATTNDVSTGAFAIDDASAYFVGDTFEYGESLVKVPLTGGNPRVLAAAHGRSVVAVGTGAVFFTDSAQGGSANLMKLPRAGGKAVPIAKNLPLYNHIAVHGSRTCWVASCDESDPQGLCQTVTCLDACQ